MVMRCFCAILLAGVLATGCAAPGHLPGPGRTRVWPAPPEKPRIGLLGEFRRPQDLGMKRGLARRVFGFITGLAPGRLHRPYAIAVTGDVEGTGPGGGKAHGPERIAIADTEAKVVHLYDLKQPRQLVLAKVGDKQRLLTPVAVAFDADKRLYVCDSALALVVRYRADGTFDRVICRGVRRPAGIAIDRDRKFLYVSDAAEHTVRKFDLDGRPLGIMGSGYRFPTHLCIDRGGRLIVSDSMNFRIVVLSPEGKVLMSSASRPGNASGDMPRPKGVAVDSRGHLYVVDAMFDNIQIFNVEGSLLLAFGSGGDGPGQFALPGGLAIDERDLIYVADAYNGRIQVFRFLTGGDES